MLLKIYLMPATVFRQLAKYRNRQKGEIMRKKMPETEYRASRVCRILGNPTAYQVIKALLHSEKSPSILSSELGLSLTTISDVLKNLRNVDLVRYEVKANERIYWLKHDSLIEILLCLENLVKQIRIEKW